MKDLIFASVEMVCFNRLKMRICGIVASVPYFLFFALTNNALPSIIFQLKESGNRFRRCQRKEVHSLQVACRWRQITKWAVKRPGQFEQIDEFLMINRKHRRKQGNLMKTENHRNQETWINKPRRSKISKFNLKEKSWKTFLNFS